MLFFFVHLEPTQDEISSELGKLVQKYVDEMGDVQSKLQHIYRDRQQRVYPIFVFFFRFFFTNFLLENQYMYSRYS